MIPEQLREKLKNRLEEGNLRVLPSPQNGIDFWSNDYLGIGKQLRQEPKTISFGGSTGSRLISGNSLKVMNLEEELADFYHAPSALIFNSGYVANLAVMSSLPQRGDLILYDALCHASLRDGIRLSFAKAQSFKHNDLEDLESRLAQNKKVVKFIVVESIYSMDGDGPDSLKLYQLAKKYDAWIILDEAHGTGNLGKSHRGMFEEIPQDRTAARIHTFGKALGAHGAVVVGNLDLQSFLINFARPFIYTTALPDASLQEIKAAHEIFKVKKIAFTRLKENINYFRLQAKKNTLNINDSEAPIQAFFGDTQQLKRIEKDLNQHGILAKTIQHPTVEKDKERIRIILHSYNTRNEIDALIKIVTDNQ